MGKTNNVSNVATSKPPITTVASGLCTSAPAPLLNAIGRKPRDATNAVINTGRNLTFVPDITTLRLLPTLLLLILLNSEMSTIPFKTATPKSAIKPMPALMLNGMSRKAKNKIPPIADNGIEVKIKTPCLTLLKAK